MSRLREQLVPYLLLLGVLLLSPQLCRADEAPLILRERARESIAGPATMLGLGLTLLVAAPFASLALAFRSQDSGDWFCEQDCPQTNNNGADAAAIISGVVLSLAGSGLSAYGMTRVIQIRSARRKLARLQNVSTAITANSASLGFRFRF
jgi:hypothetical protein